MRNITGYQDFKRLKHNESVGRPRLRLYYYCFDWDDNILNMPTIIHMEHLVDGEWVREDVSTERFREVRTLEDWRYPDDAFVEFRDFGPRGDSAFMEDSLEAIEKGEFGPSWDAFVKCIEDGCLFSIITARGHEPDTIRRVVEYIINNVLSQESKDKMAASLFAFRHHLGEEELTRDIPFEDLVDVYLDHCQFIGISSEYFANKHPELERGNGGPANPEQAKQAALKDFIDEVNKYPGAEVKLGFSDDDPRNVRSVEEFFDQIGDQYDIEFTVFDTSNPEIKGGIKKDIKEGSEIPDQYKKMGFSKVGQKKRSNRSDKKWMVLAKKGDKYKVVHGGDPNMEDYTQHKDEERRKNFWDRMGGKDSAKAKDPFSPLYWHKKFGTW